MAGDQLTIWVSGAQSSSLSPPKTQAAQARDQTSAMKKNRRSSTRGGNHRKAPEFVSLAEGQEVMAFLRWDEWYDPVANVGTHYDVVTLLLSLDYAGVGLFARDLDGPDIGANPFMHAATAATNAVPEPTHQRRDRMEHHLHRTHPKTPRQPRHTTDR